MNIIALVKYIPNPEGTPQMGPDHRLVREGVEGALDPGDEHVVEAALQLAEQSGGQVTVLSMGPEPALAAIRRALSMGAHKGVLITDAALPGADTLVTARVLAATIKRGEFDLVIGGVESTDGYTGTLPMAVANEPRYPTLKGIMQAKQKPMENLSLGDLGVSAEDAKATQEVMGVEPVPAKEAGEILEDPGQAPARVVELLARVKVI